MPTTLRVLFVASVSALASAGSAQTFVIQAPGVPPAGQNFESYQGDFGDIDRDGDPDIGLAAYGSNSRLWLNSGLLQGGAAGTFSDATATRFPALANYHARDLDFLDLDIDGDLDVFLAHDSDGGSNNTSRWWINMGGAQGGTEGFFQDQTAARWLDLNTGATSIAATFVLPGGGFIDWSWDSEFGDLDNDGDLDLFHTSVGFAGSSSSPTRVFLNDGNGAFREFNPSGFRLSGATIASGDPGLWCAGTQTPNTLLSDGTQCDVASNTFESELADFDGDFDLDFLQGGQPDRPRYFRNRINENGGVLAFRDVTGAVFPASYAIQGGYGQGVADNDGDIDVYGLNWASGLSDHVLVNNGAGSFTIGSLIPMSNEDEEDADFFDYDNDGDLDVLLAGYAFSQELYRNELGGAGGFTKQSMLIQGDTLIAFDNDVADADLDGDIDFIVTNSGNPGCQYFLNTSQIGDTFAPTVPLLEQAPNRNASAVPTIVRAHVFDNISDYVVATYAVELEYSVNGSAFASTPMRWMGAQVFRGELPGQLSGAILYRVRATDRSGNSGVSSSKSFIASGWANYCTAGTTSNGCVGSMSASGTPSASASNGFTLFASSIEGQKPTLIFYGANGRIAQPWGLSSSFLCVKAPGQRMDLMTASGTANACDGAVSIDWNNWIGAHPSAHGQPFSAGDVVVTQTWFRDPPSPKTTALTDALEFIVGP